MYSRQDVRINTKIKDNEELIKLLKPICDFATKHDVSFNSGFDEKGNLVVTYEAEGKTSAYCKGMVLATDSNEILVNSIAIDTKTAVNLLHIFSMFSSPLYNAYIESPLLTIEYHIYLTFSINSLFFQTFHLPLFS